MKDNISAYELVVILKPDTTEEDQKNFFRKLKDIVENSSGKVEFLETWGSRLLANPIDKLSRGVYFHMLFTSAPVGLEEMQRVMLIDEISLRFHFLRLSEKLSLEKHLENFKECLQESQKYLEMKKAKAAKFNKRSGVSRTSRPRS